MSGCTESPGLPWLCRGRHHGQHELAEMFAQSVITRSVSPCVISLPKAPSSARVAWGLDNGQWVPVPRGHWESLTVTTMIYTHVLNRGGLGVNSPADLLGERGSACRIRLLPVPWKHNGLRIVATRRRSNTG